MIVIIGTASLSLILSAVGALYTLSWLTPWPKRSRKDLLRKVFAYDPSGVEQDQFPCLIHESPDASPRHTQPSKYLSVIVPAMNEKERLPVMLDECLPYLESRSKKDSWFNYEVIIVDDGSSDGTCDVAFEYSNKYDSDTVKVLRLGVNQGKGSAVRNGVMCARGKVILFADADGATRFADLEKLEEQIQRSTTKDGTMPPDVSKLDWSFPTLAVGSRAHMEAESIATRSLARTVLMIGFHMLAYLFTVRTVRDTQCGFKLFTRGAAARLFPALHIERWAFDVELLYLAERYRYPIKEVAVTWHEVDGSKIVPIWSWVQMGRDLVLIWFRYFVGIWNSQVTV